MKTTRKYHGPCSEHPVFRDACRHCKAHREQLRYRGYVKVRTEVPIYRGLHWPAPDTG